MTSEEIREKFIEFFESKGHKEERPSSLVSDDPTTLFTTAGMQQFKKFYLEPSEAPGARVVTIQPCLRTSDIEEVGDESHLTFFEMLGNFSFGYPLVKESYFKKEAIEWAWEFLTSVLGIEKSRLSATYFKGGNGLPEDKESLEILKSIKELKNIKGEDFKENFWSLGAEGSPGGPTVEFYIDGVEVWNLVFNEYIYRSQRLPFGESKFEPSKFKGVDTGMGLERLAVVMQDKNDVFETDLFKDIIKKIEDSLNIKYAQHVKEIRRIADHYRSVVQLIKLGLTPSNKEHGYILRVLLRVIFVIIHDLKADYSKKFNNSWNGMIYLFKQRFKNLENIILTLFSEDQKIKYLVTNEYREYRKLEKSGINYFKKYRNAKLITGEIIFDGRGTFGLDRKSIIELWKRMDKKISHREPKEYRKAIEKHQEASRAGAEKKFKGGLADKGEETTKLHTAAHLLLAALRKILGTHVIQKGSNITPERLRLDFSHSEKLTQEQIQQTEKLVNEQIQKNLPVKMEEMSLEEAKKSRAMGVFDERYGDKVKVYSIGNFSKEICGGPHEENTSELGKFKITKEESSSSGIRRIKAVLE